MRRPTPLPPPPGGGRTDVARSDAAPLSPRDGDATDDDRTATAPIAPLIPLPTHGVSDGTLPPPAAVGALDAVTEPTGPQHLRLRDLWRAARARRRALRAEVRRFTVRQRRRRIAWLGAAASLVLLVAATVGVAYSPLFALERIQVVGASQLPADTVADALSGQLGTPLAAIDESAIKAALVAFPLVESYTLEASPPHDLVVRIVERTPVGVISSAAGYSLVDAAGVALATTQEPPAGYPELDVSGGIGSDAFAAAGKSMRSLPADLRAQVTVVSASSPDDVRLTIGGAEVVWGSADQSAKKALVLQKIMAARPGQSAYDVSSPDAVVVR
jgi:cell division protein FtsQ